MVGNEGSDSDVPMCQCYPPLPAVPRTVMKEGNNQVKIIEIFYNDTNKFKVF